MLYRLLKTALMLPLMLGLCQCGRLAAVLKPAAKTTPYSFDIVLKLTPRAEAKLKTSDDSVVAAAWYYGDALPAFRNSADALNRIALGEERWGYARGTRRMHLTGAKVDSAKFSRIRNAEPQVLVTVYTIQRAGNPDEMLTCHNYIGPVEFARANPPVIECDFNSEDYLGDAMPR